MRPVFAFAPDFRARVLALPQLLRHGGTGSGAALPGGQSEFLGYRSLSQGDDLRRVDWNIFARLDQLHVKELGRGEAPEVLIVIDRSGSMADATGGKDRLSRELAVALGHLGLVGGSEVQLCSLGEGGLVTLGRWRGVKRMDTVLQCVERLEIPRGGTWLGALEHLPPRSGAGRACFLITDALVDPLPAAGFAALGRSDDAALFLLSAASERSLDAGRWSCTGGEGEAPLDLSVERNLQSAYLAALAQHEEAVTALARKHRIHSVVATDEQPFEAAVQQCLRQSGAGG